MRLIAPHARRGRSAAHPAFPSGCYRTPALPAGHLPGLPEWPPSRAVAVSRHFQTIKTHNLPVISEPADGNRGMLAVSVWWPPGSASMVAN